MKLFFTIINKIVKISILLFFNNLYVLSQNCENICTPCDNFQKIISQSFTELPAGSCCATPIRTFFHARSQGANTARELVGWQWELNRPFMCNNYGSVYVTYEYQQTFNPDQIANVLFGGPTLKFAGSEVPHRNPNTDLLADYWGLSQNFEGTATFKPYIRSHIVDIGFYMGLDFWVQNLYVRFHFPVVQTVWSLNGSENILSNSPTFPPCYMSSKALNDDNFNSILPTPTIPTLQDALGGPAFGDTGTIDAARIIFCPLNKAGLADIDFILGYNFWNTDCYHFGLYIQNVLPTAAKHNFLILFDPRVGNNGHYELGLGISAHAVLTGNQTRNISIFLEGNVTHLFKNLQGRTFDFCKNGPFSRYMLAKLYDVAGYKSLISASAVALQPVHISVDLKYDISTKLAFRWHNFGLDLGYNIYGHTEERVRLLTPNTFVSAENAGTVLAFKGTEGVCCSNYPIVLIPEEGSSPDIKIFPDRTQGLVGAQVPENCPELTKGYIVTSSKSNASQPNATAFSGSKENYLSSVSCDVSLAYNSPTITNPNGFPENAKTIEQFIQAINQSDLILCNNTIPSQFLNICDINVLSGQAPPVLTHKLFAHFNHTWYDNCWNPHLGIGGEVEFNGIKVNDCPNKFASLNQFGIWIKAGVSF